ncbi:hypothetical protein [Microbulbifer sp. VAAF005]|uniref:hypothetical protein n=1 Tax=Microbulbifer sp. VAAF005 TaxID=3034230 RepID=UPI0024AD0D79|nr:hypothetical protein [Microbulbifer sp. VAAF005]WHI47707.1 hypothetical protein P0078_04760 [Microbulbifer sp. VAAF005]
MMKGAAKEGKKMSSSFLVQSAADHLRDTALQTSTIAGKAFQKWLMQPLNLFFLLIIIVAHIQLIVAVVQSFLMLLLSKLMG